MTDEPPRYRWTPPRDDRVIMEDPVTVLKRAARTSRQHRDAFLEQRPGLMNRPVAQQLISTVDDPAANDLGWFILTCTEVTHPGALRHEALVDELQSLDPQFSDESAVSVFERVLAVLRYSHSTWLHHVLMATAAPLAERCQGDSWTVPDHLRQSCADVYAFEFIRQVPSPDFVNPALVDALMRFDLAATEADFYNTLRTEPSLDHPNATSMLSARAAGLRASGDPRAGVLNDRATRLIRHQQLLASSPSRLEAVGRLFHEHQLRQRCWQLLRDSATAEALADAAQSLLNEPGATWLLDDAVRCLDKSWTAAQRWEVALSLATALCMRAFAAPSGRAVVDLERAVAVETIGRQLARSEHERLAACNGIRDSLVQLSASRLLSWAEMELRVLVADEAALLALDHEPVADRAARTLCGAVAAHLDRASSSEDQPAQIVDLQQAMSWRQEADARFAGHPLVIGSGVCVDLALRHYRRESSIIDHRRAEFATAQAISAAAGTPDEFWLRSLRGSVLTAFAAESTGPDSLQALTEAIDEFEAFTSTVGLHDPRMLDVTAELAGIYAARASRLPPSDARPDCDKAVERIEWALRTAPDHPRRPRILAIAMTVYSTRARSSLLGYQRLDLQRAVDSGAEAHRGRPLPIDQLCALSTAYRNLAKANAPTQDCYEIQQSVQLADDALRRSRDGTRDRDLAALTLAAALVERAHTNNPHNLADLDRADELVEQLLNHKSPSRLLTDYARRATAQHLRSTSLRRRSAHARGRDKASLLRQSMERAHAAINEAQEGIEVDRFRRLGLRTDEPQVTSLASISELAALQLWAGELEFEIAMMADGPQRTTLLGRAIASLRGAVINTGEVTPERTKGNVQLAAAMLEKANHDRADGYLVAESNRLLDEAITALTDPASGAGFERATRIASHVGMIELAVRAALTANDPNLAVARLEALRCQDISDTERRRHDHNLVLKHSPTDAPAYHQRLQELREIERSVDAGTLPPDAATNLRYALRLENNRLREQHPALRNLGRTPTVDDIRPRLRDDQALIYLVPTDPLSAIIVTSRDTKVLDGFHISLDDATEMIAKIDSWITGPPTGADVAAFHRHHAQAVDEFAELLWSSFAEPLVARLDRRTVEIILVPCGRLSTIPWHAATYDSEALIDRYLIVHAFNAWPRSLDDETAYRRVVVFRDSSDISDDLPRASEEAQQVAKLTEAEPCSFSDHLDLEEVYDLHVASHGSILSDGTLGIEITGPESVRSRLGALTLRQLTQLQRGLLFVNACSSDYSRLWLTHETVGLPAAAISAGFAFVIAAGWPMEDVVAYDFAIEFYDIKASLPGIAPVELLRRTQMRLRTSRWTQPHCWAALRVFRALANRAD